MDPKNDFNLVSRNLWVKVLRWKADTLTLCFLENCWWFRNPADSPVEVGSFSHYLQVVSRISEPSTVWCTSDRIHEKLGQHIDRCFMSLATIHPKIYMPIEAILESHDITSSFRSFHLRPFLSHIFQHEFFNSKKTCSKTKPPVFRPEIPENQKPPPIDPLEFTNSAWANLAPFSAAIKAEETKGGAVSCNMEAPSKPPTPSNNLKATHIENERMSPEKGPFERERVVFQPPFFRGHVGFRRSIEKKNENTDQNLTLNSLNSHLCNGKNRPWFCWLSTVLHI